MLLSAQTLNSPGSIYTCTQNRTICVHIYLSYSARRLCTFRDPYIPVQCTQCSTIYAHVYLSYLARRPCTFRASYTPVQCTQCSTIYAHVYLSYSAIRPCTLRAQYTPVHRKVQYIKIQISDPQRVDLKLSGLDFTPVHSTIQYMYIYIFKIISKQTLYFQYSFTVKYMLRL